MLAFQYLNAFEVWRCLTKEPIITSALELGMRGFYLDYGFMLITFESTTLHLTKFYISQRLYNLGTDGDTDTEYLGIFTPVELRILHHLSGNRYTGTARTRTIGTGNTGATFNEVGQQRLLYGVGR